MRRKEYSQVSYYQVKLCNCSICMRELLGVTNPPREYLPSIFALTPELYTRINGRPVCWECFVQASKGGIKPAEFTPRQQRPLFNPDTDENKR
jgi:hypothetical protein